MDWLKDVGTRAYHFHHVNAQICVHELHAVSSTAHRFVWPMIDVDFVEPLRNDHSLSFEIIDYPSGQRVSHDMRLVLAVKVLWRQSHPERSHPWPSYLSFNILTPPHAKITSSLLTDTTDTGTDVLFHPEFTIARQCL
ncbi:hypothetical protein V8E55_011998 [Tylopilus felleus]